MNEDQLIEKYFVGKTGDNVVLGIGDDAAVLDIPDGYQLVISTDTLLAGVHFPDNFPPEYVAKRALGVCVSDLAAMAAIPKWMTLSLSLPDMDHNWLEGFSRNLHAGLGEYEMSLIGGDTVKGPLMVSLSVMGIVEQGTALQRDSANLNDDIYVSGVLGGAAFALFKILAEERFDNVTFQRFAQPQARVRLGRALRTVASACMDVSDGVLLDLSRMLRKSGLGARIDLDAFPFDSGIEELPFESRIRFASSGDDYELLFTASPERRSQIQALSKELEIALTRIGRITDGPSLHTYTDGAAVQTPDGGYQHF